MFGRDSDGRAVWDGLLEAVALSARAMTAEEARRSHRGWAARLAARRPPPRLVVVARPAARPRVPDPASLAPYRRALVADRYTVERVEMGQFEGGDLLAAGWAVLDGEALPLDRESGGPRRLVLEPYDEHPELEGERLIAEGESWRWPLFYKVETPAE